LKGSPIPIASFVWRSIWVCCSTAGAASATMRVGSGLFDVRQKERGRARARRAISCLAGWLLQPLQLLPWRGSIRTQHTGDPSIIHTRMPHRVYADRRWDRWGRRTRGLCRTLSPPLFQPCLHTPSLPHTDTTHPPSRTPQPRLLAAIRPVHCNHHPSFASGSHQSPPSLALWLLQWLVCKGRLTLELGLLGGSRGLCELGPPLDKRQDEGGRGLGSCRLCERWGGIVFLLYRLAGCSCSDEGGGSK